MYNASPWFLPTLSSMPIRRSLSDAFVVALAQQLHWHDNLAQTNLSCRQAFLQTSIPARVRALLRYINETTPEMAFGEYWDSCDYSDGVGVVYALRQLELGVHAWACLCLVSCIEPYLVWLHCVSCVCMPGHACVCSHSEP